MTFKPKFPLDQVSFDQQVRERIQCLRISMMQHSCLYYQFNISIMNDYDWDILAKELFELQRDYPERSEEVTDYYLEEFRDWAGEGGSHLPLSRQDVQDRSWNMYVRYQQYMDRNPTEMV